MGLIDRLKKLVSDQLRPWLVCDVFPIINISTSGITLKLPHLEFDVDALNAAGMESSPLVVKEAMKVEVLQLSFTPFRQPVLMGLVQGWEVVLEPRSAGDAYWEKKREKAAEQQEAGALFAMDPQGASIHTAAEGLVEEKPGSGMIAHFVMNLMLTSVRLEFHNCSLKLVSHIVNGLQHSCTIPLSSFEIGEGKNGRGYLPSGGLIGSFTSALSAVRNKSTLSMSKFCVVSGLGLEVETRDVTSVDTVEGRWDTAKERTAAEVDEVAAEFHAERAPVNDDTISPPSPERSLTKLDKHIVLLQDLLLGFRFVELAMESLEFDVPKAAFSIDMEEIDSLNALIAQIQGPLQHSTTEVDRLQSDADVTCGSGNPKISRSPVELWRTGIRKALELSPRRRLESALQAGISRRRYSIAYESWLRELRWGEGRQSWAKRKQRKAHLDQVKKLSRDISEMEKHLPLEAIVLARRVARSQIPGPISEDTTTGINSNPADDQKECVNPSFYRFFGSLWRNIMLAIIFMQGRVTGVITWMSAARRLGVNEWKLIRGVLRGSSTDTARKIESVGSGVDSRPGVESDYLPQRTVDRIALAQSISDSNPPQKYFQLGAGDQEDMNAAMPGTKRQWQSIYALKIGTGSITLTSGAIGTVHSGSLQESYSKEEGIDEANVVIPAIHFSLKKLILAYGSTQNSSASTISCGNLKAELVSVLPQLKVSEGFSLNLDPETFQKEFSTCGRWMAKASDRAKLLSSRPCPKPRNTGLHYISDIPLASGMYDKHWSWQGRQIMAWSGSWPATGTKREWRDSQSMEWRNSQPTAPISNWEESINRDKRPFMILESNSLDDDPTIGDCPRGVIKFAITVGRLDFSLKGSFLPRVSHLLNSFMSSKSASENGVADSTEVTERRNDGQGSFEDICKINYDQYMGASQKAMIAAIPEKSIVFSAIVDGPKLRLGATASELQEHRHKGNYQSSKKSSRPDPKMGATVVFDFGRLEMAMWPPQRTEEARGGLSEQTVNVSDSPNDLWDHVVDSKLWMKKPPRPALPWDYSQRRYCEHDQVGNNLYLYMEDIALILQLRKESFRELSIVGPLALCAETSICWDQYTSLFAASKSVSAAVNANIFSLSLQGYMQEVSIILQIVDLYSEALSLRSDTESIGISGRGDTVSKTEGSVPSPQNNRKTNVAYNPSLVRADEASFTLCALTFSAELEKLKLVLGHSRKEEGHSATRKRSAEASTNVKKDLGMRHGSREGKAYFMNNENYLDGNDSGNHVAFTWDQIPPGPSLDKEAYILGQDALIHISLGDDQQFCTFVGMKDFLLRLVDSGSMNSANDLSECRNQFFNTSVSDRRVPSHLSGQKSFSGSGLSEASVEYVSFKVFGPKSQEDEGHTNDFPHHRRVASPNAFKTEVDLLDEDLEDGEAIRELELSQLSTQLSGINFGENVQPSEVRNSITSLVRSTSRQQLHREDQGSSQGQHTPRQFSRANDAGFTKDETRWFAADIEIGKILVTDGALDTLVAKVLLVESGAENMHMELGLHSNFQKISWGLQGGLVLVHTAALASLSEFFADIGELLAQSTTPSRAPEVGRETPGYAKDESSIEIRKVPSLSSVYRSSSVPAESAFEPNTSTAMRKKKMKRVFSAPPTSLDEPLKDAGHNISPNFEGSLCSNVAGISLVLARHSGTSSVPAEGVLFELDMSMILEMGDSARKFSFDLSRFSILGLQARLPSNSRKSPGRTNSRIPRFASSFKVPSQTDVQGLSSQQKKASLQNSFQSELALSSLDDPNSDSEMGGTIGRGAGNLSRTSSLRSLPELSSSREVDMVAAGDSDSRGSLRPQRQTSVNKQAEGFQRAKSEYNASILEHLSLHCTIEKVADKDRVWKWSEAWQGQCSLLGFNLAVTTSEIQMLESLVAPLSSSGGSSKSDDVESDVDTQFVGASPENNDGVFEIPDGAVIAIKDVREHCYLAAEKMPNDTGKYRLVGVLHYSLAEDQALFKVKYHDPSSRGGLSLLSLHAKDSNGEPFRIHYRSSFALADVSSTKDGSWEQWQFRPAESSSDDVTEVDKQNPSFRHIFYLINSKSKRGIAFEENVPVMVHEPGNPFKVKIIAKPPPSQKMIHTNLGNQTKTPLPLPPLNDEETVGLVTSIPHVVCTFETVTLTILHEAAGGQHLLPLVRLRIPGTEGVMQLGTAKTRIILLCSIVLEYYETQSSQWVAIINPIGTEICYRARSLTHGLTPANQMKTPVAFFLRFRKVEFVVSEPSLDACLFLIGALDLAGPYTVRYSPTRANRCLVDNQTGLDALCCFDQGSSKMDGVIPSWHSDSFLMRHMASRRDTGPAKVASTLELYLQKSGKGATSPVVVTLGDPGVIAVKTRLQTDEGRKSSGPMVVVDVSRRNQDGISVRVSPLVRVRNACGLPLELRCRRNSQKEEGAVVLLEDGDAIDDSMGAFDALHLEGSMRRALSALNLGTFRLSIRPVILSSSESLEESGSPDVEPSHDWSEDVKGAKAVRSAGLFDKLQYSFNKTVKAHNLETKFGTVFCPKIDSSTETGASSQEEGYYFMIRTTCRQVPISRPKPASDPEHPRGRYTIVAWQQQQELLLLPTVRVLNLMTSNISILLASKPEGGRKAKASLTEDLHYNASIKSFGRECMYMDLGDLFLTVKHEDLELVSKTIRLEVGSKEFSQNTKGESLRDIEMEVDFGDGVHTALVTVSRGDDGVLEIVFLTRYCLQNDSHVTLLCCSSKQPKSRWGGLRSAKNQEPQWPSTGVVMTIGPKSKLSWFDRSTKILIKRTEAEAEPALLDLESVSGSMEISLRIPGQDSVDNRIQLGVQLNIPSPGDANPSCTILLLPRYIVANDSGEEILVCQDGFQDDDNALVSLAPGERSALHAQVLPDQKNRKPSEGEELGSELLLALRFRPKGAAWNWSGPVCAAAIGSFSIKISRSQPEDTVQKSPKEGLIFAVADVQEKAASLLMTFRRQSADAIPYRIENALRTTSITYNQQGLDTSEVLEAGSSVGYVWDDLGDSHTLSVSLAGTSLSGNINPDKLRSWKSFKSSRRTKGFLQIPFLDDLSTMAMYGDGAEDDHIRAKEGLPPIGYEVYADGLTRVVRICEERDGRVDRRWQSNVSSPTMEINVRIPLFTINIVEPAKQSAENELEPTGSSEALAYSPVINLRLINVLIEAIITPEYTLFQTKAESLDVDVKWQGAPVAAMLRGHGQDRFARGRTVFHMAVVMSNLVKNPIHLRYASILLQAVDLNIDEETLMKLVPFYRYSLSDSTAPSRQIYFERFEIHPIKIVGSFLPGAKPRADYSSAQETLRALLHSVIKIPTVRGNTVELNGVLLSNALLTFKQLALKCAQHYSWYSMRAIYIARGSKLLPPGFASLFDDSAASSLDVFFDPSSGSIDVQGLTIGMFGVLSRGLRKRGKGGTQRYLGDLQLTVKAAGSNLLFAVMTEVSDSVLKGADASGLDGLLGGFRRGILNVAMKPSVLRGAVVQGGSTRRIKLDRLVGTDEAYIEGYLQAMLDAVFKQNYLRVQVVDDQVILSNLPPNTTLMDEIISCVRNFLIGEGLLAGESSAAALSSLRRLRGEEERRFGPTVIALCEQLLVIIVVRSLRRQTVKLLVRNNITFFGDGTVEKPEPPKPAEEDSLKEQPSQQGGFFQGINFKRAVTGFALSSVLAYADGRLCRHIPNPLVRRIVSGFLLSFVE